VAQCKLALPLGFELYTAQTFKFTQSLPPSLENTLRTYCYSGAFSRRPGSPLYGSPNTFHAFTKSFGKGVAPSLRHSYGVVLKISLPTGGYLF
jgi:hypothetical protein